LFAYEDWLSRPWSWIVVLRALITFFFVLGIWITQQPLGVSINECNLMSLSRRLSCSARLGKPRTHWVLP